MKIKTRIVSLLICLIILFNHTAVIGATYTEVEILSELGLISNTSSYDMYAQLNRLVGLTMILKASGYTDKDASALSTSTVFTDLIGSYKWGIGWVNIGIERSITTGTSATTFSPGYMLTKKEFTVYLLRLLGYGMLESYEKCETLAIEAGLIEYKSDLTDAFFTKSDAAHMIFTALSCKIKDKGNTTLIEQMIADGIVNKDLVLKHKIKGYNTLRIGLIQPLSNNYLELRLEEAVTTVNTSDYSLIDNDNNDVEIISVNMYNSGRTIIIKTEEQEIGTTHTLSIGNKDFTYVSLPKESVKPRLMDVEVINNTKIRLIFDENMSEKALTQNYYTISGLTVKSAEYEVVKVEEDEDEDDLDNTYIVEPEYEIDMKHIILNTSSQVNNKAYLVEVSNVTDLSDNKVDLGYNDCNFWGEKEDSDKPRLSSAIAVTKTKVKLEFSEDLNEEIAEQIENYTIDDLTIVRATLDADASIVYLITSEQKEDKYYTVYVTNLEDLEGNKIDVSYDTKAFSGKVKDEIKPRLVNVIPVSNTKVEVIFDEPIDESTALMEYAYYFGDELGYALDVEKDTVTTDGTIWIVTTLPQLAQEYTLTIKGLKDIEGNLIDENHKTDTFIGIP